MFNIVPRITQFDNTHLQLRWARQQLDRKKSGLEVSFMQQQNTIVCQKRRCNGRVVQIVSSLSSCDSQRPNKLRQTMKLKTKRYYSVCINRCIQLYMMSDYMHW